MFFLIKTALLGAVIVFGGSYIINHVPWLKDRVIEIINPAVKESRLLNDLKQNLVFLDSGTDDLTSTKDPAVLKATVQRYQQALNQSKILVNAIDDLSSQKTGLIQSGLSRISDYIFGEPSSTSYTTTPNNNAPTVSTSVSTVSAGDTSSTSPTPVPCAQP